MVAYTLRHREAGRLLPPKGKTGDDFETVTYNLVERL